MMGLAPRQSATADQSTRVVRRRLRTAVAVVPVLAALLLGAALLAAVCLWGRTCRVSCALSCGGGS
jgi:hypothetical protein